MDLFRNLHKHCMTALQCFLLATLVYEECESTMELLGQQKHTKSDF